MPGCVEPEHQANGCERNGDSKHQCAYDRRNQRTLLMFQHLPECIIPFRENPPEFFGVHIFKMAIADEHKYLIARCVVLNSGKYMFSEVQNAVGYK